ncbi:MAG: response regulator [Gemmatimonadales bacterium]
MTAQDALATRLMAVFVSEFEEQLRVMNADLLALEAQPGNPERLKSLFRVAHTLKGAARAAGVPPVETACHAAEGLLADARDGKRSLEPEHFEALFATADVLQDAHQCLAEGAALPEGLLDGVAERLRLLRSRPEGAVAPRAVPAFVPPVHSGDSEVRVRPEALDALLGSASQLLVTAAGNASRPAELEALADALAATASDWRRTARRLRLILERSGPSGGAGALEDLDARLHRLAHDSARLAAGLGRDAREVSRAADEVLGRVRRVRLRPFADACDALPRAARDLAASTGKEVELEIVGGDVQADRAVLDRVREALLQLVRNAVAHGIERPDERESAGKPRRGRITIAAALRGDRIAITVADDGAGLNVAAIRSRLAGLGRPTPADERVLVRGIFEGGMSTTADATVISGRGVGLDIVRAAMAAVRGGVEVTWVAGKGTTFTLTCPPSLASVRALLVLVGSQVLALPTSHVERVLRVTPGEIRRAEGKDVLEGDCPIPLVALARLLPPLPERPVAGPTAVAVLTAGERRLAIAVDELIAEQEIVLQQLGSGAQGLPLLSGAAMLGTGRMVLVLDCIALVAAGLALVSGGVARAEVKGAAPARQTVLVVDDSLTTRTLEQSILEAAGYDVIASVDGADGWKALQERGADAVVADVEMPRMDGFALCEAIRSAKRFKELPVILVTAMETPEHRAHGLEVGADGYIGKSSFDQENLLATLRQLLGGEAK